MKYIFTFFIIFSFATVLQAQSENDLAIDENGKFIYYEVVSLKTDKDSLNLRMLNYIKKKNKDLKFKSAQGDTAVVATGKLVINKTLLVMSHPSGEIIYHFYVEVKEQKYRFWLSNFSFIPYARDRYGNFAASTSVGIPLERDSGKLNAAEWKEYKVQAAKHAKALAVDFKMAMANVLLMEDPIKERTIVKKTW